MKIAHEYADEVHLLLTDVVMPRISGKDLIEEIIKLRPNIKTFFMVGLHGRFDCP
ncbi:MAG: hypothetical protein SWO11_20760 [Thermodesulfobacteriota bacterium]|nr:hypothetical protein [Thermodesulfobacteriota bacterium]